MVVKDKQGETEKLETTSEHPFWIKDVGWLKASLLDSGMTLLDRNNEELEVVSQHLIPSRLETVYNIEVDGFHTYHVGKLGTWVHNANCCDVRNEINGNAGTKYNWDKNLNQANLPSNSVIKVNNGTNIHSYYTDALGRVDKVEGQLSLDKMARNRYQQGKVGRSVNAKGDDGGHLIASVLGGAGDRVNMVPQASMLNRGEWKAMENFLRSELEAGKNVSIKIDVGYPNGNTTRPSSFFVIAKIDGKPKEWEFEQ